MNRNLAAALACALALSSGQARADDEPPLPAQEPDGPWLLPQVSLEWCDRLVARFPSSFPASGCYMRMSWKDGKLRSRQAAQAWLQERVDHRPDDFLARFQLGMIAQDDGQLDFAEPHLRAAAAGAHAAGHAEAEVWARTSLSIILCGDGRFSEAEPELEQATARGRESGLPDLLSLSQVWSSYCAFEAADYGRALALGLEVRQRATAGPPTWRTSWVLQLALGRLTEIYAALGQSREAFELAQALVEQVTLAYPKAAARHLVAAAAQLLADSGELSREEADRLLREALEAEVKAGVRLWINGGEFYTRLLLARRLGPTPEGLEEARRALAIGRKERDKVVIGEALRRLAAFTALAGPGQPEEALAFATEALALAHGSGLRADDVRARLLLAWLRWRSAGAADAAQATEEALAALDAFRERQPEELLRARSASDLASGFRLLAAAPLEREANEAHRAAGPAAVAEAFAVMERLRARALSDALGAVRETALPPALREEERALQLALSRAQRTLLTGGAADPSGMAALERIEEQMAGLRDRIAHAAALPPATEPATTLAALQAALGPGEAYLGFQVWGPGAGSALPEATGSSWVLAITRQTARAVRIPDAPALAPQVELLSALIARRDGAEEPGAVRLYQSLLGEALAAVGPGVRRLWIAPDGPLHKLPFGALRPALGAAPLGATTELSVVPSAALLLRWHRSQLPVAPVPLLAVADPPLTGPATAERGGDLRGAAASLGPLPGARREAAAAVRLLGGGSRALLGPEASEVAVKHEPLRRYGIVHFATHALVDEGRPERSALLLAPGSSEEDGLLQLREVAALDLTGAAVVLAACSSSAGPLLQGEGLVGLTRAFFLAGAHTVVGTLWPLRDDESEQLFAGFYQRLSSGQRVSEALRGASEERFRAGAPTAAWAGMVVLGHGSRAPLAAQVAPSGRSLWPAAAEAVLLALLLGTLWRARRSR